MWLHYVTRIKYIGFLFYKVLFKKSQPIRILYLTRGIYNANPTIFRITLIKQRFSGKWDERHQSRSSKPCSIYISFNKLSTITETWKWIRLEKQMDCFLHDNIFKYLFTAKIVRYSIGLSIDYWILSLSIHCWYILGILKRNLIYPIGV